MLWGLKQWFIRMTACLRSAPGRIPWRQTFFFISIHCNSVESPYAEGTETWYCSGSEAGRLLAECIQDQIVDSLNTVDRGIKVAVPGKNGLYVLTNTDMPAVLVELAFISNEDDEKLLRNNQDDFARAIARGVTDYL